MIIKTRVFNPWAATRTIQAIGLKSGVKLYRGRPPSRMTSGDFVECASSK